MTDERGGTSTGASEPCCKLGRGIERFDLESLDERLCRRWRGDGVEQQGLRDLAEYANQEMLRRALGEAGVRPVDGEVENLYRLLVDADVSEGRRREAERRLERQGIDAQRVREAFVSHQSVYNHLRGCLDVSYEERVEDAERLARRASALFALQNRAETVTAETLERLSGADLLALDDFDVLVDVRVACDHCGRYHEVDDLFENGGCECRTTADD
jgi:hypothetical protein